jgi:serine phosphatase RsbU (regulator of sigma subunit)
VSHGDESVLDVAGGSGASVAALPVALVVGDLTLPGQATLLRGALELREVRPAAAGSAIERESPDLLLVDGRLGDDVLGALLGRSQGPGRPGVIVLTGEASAGRLARLLGEGADELVDAEVAPRELLARVQGVLRLRELRRELLAKSAEVQRLGEQLEGIAGRMAEELRLASHVQRTLLPPPLVHPRLDLAAEYLPVREIGGDYYDVIPLEGGRMALALGDVMGKGVPAALLAANLKSCLRAHVQAGQLRPDETLVRVNRLFREVIPKGLFATLFFAVLDWRAGVVEYVNAGHEPGLLLRRDGSLVELDRGGTVLGLLEEPAYVTGRETIEADDVLVVFSDGLTDRCAANGELFGRARLRAAACRVRRDPARIALYSVLGEVQGWSGGRPAEDDQTLIVARMR